jgi:hypothetical protein
MHHHNNFLMLAAAMANLPRLDLKTSGEENPLSTREMAASHADRSAWKSLLDAAKDKLAR